MLSFSCVYYTRLSGFATAVEVMLQKMMIREQWTVSEMHPSAPLPSFYPGHYVVEIILQYILYVLNN